MAEKLLHLDQVDPGHRSDGSHSCGANCEACSFLGRGLRSLCAEGFAHRHDPAASWQLRPLFCRNGGWGTATTGCDAFANTAQEQERRMRQRNEASLVALGIADMRASACRIDIRQLQP